MTTAKDGDDNIAGPAEVYLGALETDGTAVRNRLDTNYTYGYALYPKADYAGTVMTGSLPRR